MSKIYLADHDQLKCNFCTHWFSTTEHFGRLQRYSLNVCLPCFDNFRYTIVHPTTY